jgi:micrococcal nuclease
MFHRSRLVPSFVVSAVLVSAAFLFGCGSSDAELPPDANAVVERVVDGDTIDVTIDGRGDTVRLIGIDTPETKKPDTPVECYGPEASARLAELLPPGTPVRLERDIDSRDKFGRLLAYVQREPDDLFVNAVLIDEGLARPYPFEPNTTYADQFAAAAETARTNGIGLWSACPVEPSP